MSSCEPTSDDVSPSKRTLKAKLSHLQRIKSAAIAWQVGQFPPLHLFAAAYSLVTLIIAFILLGVLDPYLGHPGSIFQAWGSLAIAVVVFGFLLFFGKAAPTHALQVDRLLTAYEPIDKSAFVALQSMVKEQHCLTHVMVRDWVDREAHSVRTALQSLEPIDFEFLSKKP